MTVPATSPWNLRLVRRKATNGLLWVGAVVATAAALLPLGMVLYYVAAQGLSSISLSFFTQLPKPVGEAGGGMANALVGSLILVGLASLIGLPIGLLGGIYLAEFGNGRLGWAIRFTADVLSGVPSIVIGMFVLALVVIPMGGVSAVAGGCALGLMMVPIAMRTTEELVRMVPMSLREGSLALGATHWRTVAKVVMQAAKGGVITGVLLAIARVAGEAAPILFTAGSTQWWNMKVTEGPMSSLPVQIFLYAGSPFEEWHRQAWGAALVLVTMVLILSVAARYATRGRMRIVR
jgi:phosphate transport system permease protein